MMERCPTCQEFYFPSIDATHRCQPRWLCWLPDDSSREDASPVHAHDAEAAAEKYVDSCDPDCDYSCVSGNPQAVHVVPDEFGTQKIQVFIVQGESVPQYRGEEVKLHPERQTLRMVTRRLLESPDPRLWELDLEDLEGESVGAFRYPRSDGHPWPPDPNDYVQLQGKLGTDGCVMFWGRGHKDRWPLENPQCP